MFLINITIEIFKNQEFLEIEECQCEIFLFPFDMHIY
jgi:hypothetical protein